MRRFISVIFIYKLGRFVLTTDNSEYIRHLLQPNKLYKIKKAKYIKTNYNYCFSQEYFLTLGNEKGELPHLKCFHNGIILIVTCLKIHCKDMN